MSELVVARAVVREKGYLYFIDKDGNICRSKMNRAGRPKKIDKQAN